MELVKNVTLSPDLLAALSQVKGYKASGIMDYTGEVLISDSKDPDTDLALVGATFNDIFRTAQEACDKIGFETTNQIQIRTPRGFVLIANAQAGSGNPVHLIAVLDADGNYALMKMLMAKIMPAVYEAVA